MVESPPLLARGCSSLRIVNARPGLATTILCSICSKDELLYGTRRADIGNQAILPYLTYLAYFDYVSSWPASRAPTHNPSRLRPKTCQWAIPASHASKPECPWSRGGSSGPVSMDHWGCSHRGSKGHALITMELLAWVLSYSILDPSRQAHAPPPSLSGRSPLDPDRRCVAIPDRQCDLI